MRQGGRSNGGTFDFRQRRKRRRKRYYLFEGDCDLSVNEIPSDVKSYFVGSEGGFPKRNLACKRKGNKNRIARKAHIARGNGVGCRDYSRATENGRAFMKVCVFTLGCKVNRYESDVIINKLIERGYEVTENLEKPIITS